jgi:NifU-like protein involved in Fe-S cluster formation
MAMNFEKFKEINDTRMNYREMEDATVVSNYRNVGCGDGYRIYLKIDENERITDASYTTTGCGFGITALAMATEIAKNKTVSEAESLTESDIEKLFEFPERRKNYPESAIAALKQAIKDFKSGDGIPKEKRITKSKPHHTHSWKKNAPSVSIRCTKKTRSALNVIAEPRQWRKPQKPQKLHNGRKS